MGGEGGHAVEVEVWGVGVGEVEARCVAGINRVGKIPSDDVAGAGGARDWFRGTDAGEIASVFRVCESIGKTRLRDVVYGVVDAGIGGELIIKDQSSGGARSRDARFECAAVED